MHATNSSVIAGVLSHFGCRKPCKSLRFDPGADRHRFIGHFPKARLRGMV
jgi:hypothetical protein